MADIHEEIITSSTATPQQQDELKTDEAGFVQNIISEIIHSPLNLLLVALIAFLIYKIIRSRSDNVTRNVPAEPELPKLRKDFTVQELKKYDGTQSDGRVLVAVNGHVYDVTKGKRFYGPGGPYSVFGGRDASRGLATFKVTSSDTDTYDDLSDLDTLEMDSVREWEMQFKEKYEYVGRLLRPGEEPTSYSDEEEETPNESNNSSNKSDITSNTNAAATSASGKSKDE